MKNVLAIQSHVVFGHAGNSAAVFPMRRLGVNVWPLNTVQFSNHTQYRKWKGSVMSAAHLMDIIDGIEDIGQLKYCDAVLSGYMGSAKQGNAIIDIVKKVKLVNPSAIYFCDPVMGHPDKGCFVASGVADFLCGTALPYADVIAPNLLELELLSGKTGINSVEDALQASRDLCKQGPRVVLVKHLNRAGYRHDDFEMLLVTPNHAWHIARPLVDFHNREPVGVGDVTSGLFLANRLLDRSLLQSLEHTTAAVYGVMVETLNCGQYELQLVAAQDEIAKPSHCFKAKRID